MYAAEIVMCTQDPAKNTLTHIINTIDFEQINYINFTFTDLLGTQKVVTIPAHLAQDAFENNLQFDGSSIAGCSTISKSDMMLKPDARTFSILPETGNNIKTAEIICDICENETDAFSGDARSILKKALAEVHEMGYEFLVGPELEFFLLIDDPKTNNPIAFDNKKYFDIDNDARIHQFKCNLLTLLQAKKINVEKIHHEVAPGQLEISIRYGNALDIADTLVRAKNSIQLLARSAGLRATFMPKPFYNQNGSGMHVHFSLFDKQNNKNAFYDGNDAHKLSLLAKQFIAGILNRTRDIALLLNQATNSYKRLVPGYEAPTNICWGTKNRSALIRIPQTKDGASNAVRAEIRCPDALANPYLLFTALIKAGLAGVKNNEIITDPTHENLYLLSTQELKNCGIQSIPSSLREAIDLFAASNIATAIFNEQTLAEFLKLKNAECNEACRAVTDWELNRYL